MSGFNPISKWARELCALGDEKDAEQAILQEAKQRAVEKRSALSLSDTGNTFQHLKAAFHQSYALHELLLQRGYDQRGDSFRHPASESGNYTATVRLDDQGVWRVNTLSTSDPLYTKGQGAHDAFSVFTVLYHGGDKKAAMIDAGDNWLTIGGESYNEVVRREYEQKKEASVPKIDVTELLKSKVKSTNQTDPTATTAPAPLFNEALDTENNYCNVNLMQHVDNNHVIKRLSIQLARETYLPANTVFLTGLAVFSAMASRKYAVQYPNKGTLPLGLYVIAEQPSGTSKTRCLSTFEKPFKEIRKRLCNKALKEFKDYLKGLGDEKPTPDQKSKLKELETEWVRLKAGLFVTNGTAEALEPVTTKNSGFFSAVSSEQGLFNSLLGKSYKAEGSSNNNDMLLNGFDGNEVNNVRINREAYSGDVIGAVCCFAQAGSIEAVLKESNGTGLAERFLMLSEPHSLGQRDHTRVVESDPMLMIAYQTFCSNMESILATPLLPEDLSNLFISPTGFQLINQYRNKIEPYLADGGRYSHISLRGAASKIDMQIMKIAANLHIADSSFEPSIPDKHVISAIAIAGELIEANLKLCQAKGIMGIKAEFTAILSLFENDQRSRNERSIIQVKSKTKPFKDFTGNKSKLIADTLAEMVGQKLLIDRATDHIYR